MTDHRRYRLDLTLEGPLLTRASGGLAFGVDQAMQLYQGRPAINGSLIRGHIRHLLAEFRQIMEEDDPAAARRLDERIQNWFGKNHMAAHETDSARSRLDFDFFWLPAERGDHSPSLHNRIRMGPNGAVDPGALIISESPVPAGAAAVFSGEIRGRFHNDHEAEAFRHWICKALHHLPAIGAMKGAGFGRIKGFDFHEVQPPETAGDLFGLLIQPDRPFCIAKPPLPPANFYVSEDHIPGNALKAVLADAWRERRGDLPEGFDALRISHALPAARQRPERPLPLPLSLAVAGERVLDLALCEAPVLIPTDAADAASLQAPVFQPDWKAADWERAAGAFGPRPVFPRRWLGVRTSIEDADEALNQAKDNGLFSLECVDPADYVWCADLDLSRVPEEARRHLLEQLPATVENLGKTKARAKLEKRPQAFAPTTEIPPVEQDQDLFIVLLRTPARLFAATQDLPPTNGAKALHQAYASYWSSASGGALELSHYFAQQQLFGGDLYWNYYRKQAPDPGDYRPEWLTQAGSVFVLRAAAHRRDQAREQLQAWQAHGLPPAPDRLTSGGERRPDDWKTDPFIPENGFGECVVNARQQLDLLADPEEDGLHEPQ